MSSCGRGRGRCLRHVDRPSSPGRGCARDADRRLRSGQLSRQLGRSDRESFAADTAPTRSIRSWRAVHSTSGSHWKLARAGRRCGIGAVCSCWRRQTTRISSPRRHTLERGGYARGRARRATVARSLSAPRRQRHPDGAARTGVRRADGSPSRAHADVGARAFRVRRVSAGGSRRERITGRAPLGPPGRWR